MIRKKPYVVDLPEASLHNTAFRQVLFRGDKLELTLMTLRPGESIGLEVHPTADQLIRVEHGTALFRVDGLPRLKTRQGAVVIVPRGRKHNVTNASSVYALRLSTVYAPPQHEEGRVDARKPEGPPPVTPGGRVRRDRR